MTPIGGTASRRLTVGPLAAHSKNVQTSHLHTSSFRFQSRETGSKAIWEQALEELFSISRDRFLGVAYCILKNHDDSEDAVQDAFLSASRHFANFEGRAAVTTWLTRIVINAALMLRRKRKNTFIRAVNDLDRNEADYLETIPGLHPDPEMASSRAESFALLDGLINEMNPLLRQAVKSAYYDELSSSEASSALAIPLSTYKARLFRGTRLLQDRARKKTKGSAL
jgi:RNA polymerase sigma-70 factor (ECF subfamily)